MESLYHQDCRAECLAWLRDKGYMSSPMALFSMKVWECRADGTMRQTCSQKPMCHDEGCESTSLKTEHNRLWPCVCVCEWEETDMRAGLNNCASHQEQAPMGARKSHGEHQEFIKWCKNTEQTQDVGTWAVEITVEPLKRKKTEPPTVFSELYFRKVLKTSPQRVCLPTQLLLPYDYIHAAPCVITTG